MSAPLTPTLPVSIPSIPTSFSLSVSQPSGPSSLTTPTIVPPPTPTSNNNSNSNSGSGNVIDSGALYLYTFLATLVLLLSVSCAIVIRSIILRRRRNRFLAEAMANGTWVARGTYRDPGAKPSLFEAHVTDLKHAPAQDELEWDAITPFSATYVNASSSDAASEKSGPAPAASGSPIARVFDAFRTRRRPRLQLPLPVSASQRSLSQNTSASPAPQPASPGPAVAAAAGAPPSTSPASTLRIAVLIAMPSPNHLPHSAVGGPHHHLHGGNDDDDEDAIPHVEFGVAEIGVGPSPAGPGSSAANNHDRAEG